MVIITQVDVRSKAGLPKHLLVVKHIWDVLGSKETIEHKMLGIVHDYFNWRNWEKNERGINEEVPLADFGIISAGVVGVYIEVIVTGVCIGTFSYFDCSKMIRGIIYIRKHIYLYVLLLVFIIAIRSFQVFPNIKLYQRQVFWEDSLRLKVVRHFYRGDFSSIYLVYYIVHKLHGIPLGE